MKIALITDTHFGARNNSPVFDEFFEKFYSQIFFPYLQDNDIKTIVHLGDVFEHRKSVNFASLHAAKRYFFDKIEDYHLDAHFIAGNHDCFYKNSNEVNSIDLLLAEYKSIHTYSEHTEVEFDGTKILLMPWVCSSNYNDSVEAMKKTKADILFGHFEIAGFQMYKGTKNEHGFNKAVFDRFDIVYSGHFHHRSSDSNITYLGTPYEIVWSDYDDPKGFHIFDTETRELTFVPNPYTIFEKYYYNDETQDPMEISSDIFENKVVKIVVEKKEDFNKFDNFIDRINRKNPIDLKIIEDYSEFELSVIDDDNIDIEDTFSLVSTYIDSVETDMNKDRVKDIMKTLYIEAMHAEKL